MAITEVIGRIGRPLAELAQAEDRFGDDIEQRKLVDAWAGVTSEVFDVLHLLEKDFRATLGVAD